MYLYVLLLLKSHFNCFAVMYVTNQIRLRTIPFISFELAEKILFPVIAATIDGNVNIA